MWNSVTEGSEARIIHRGAWLSKEIFLYDLVRGNDKIIGVYFATCYGAQFTQCLSPDCELAAVEGADFFSVDALAIIQLKKRRI